MRRSFAAFVVAALALPALALAGACRDATGPLPAHTGDDTPAYGAGIVARLNCTGNTTTLSLECKDADAPKPGAARKAILGGGYVKLKSYNPVYDTTSLIFSFDVTLQNLLTNEPIGTPDGTTAVGSKVFYHDGPRATAYYNAGDTGSVTVANAEGFARFTHDHQPYHFYPQILAPQEISPLKHWELRMPRTVKSFSFLLYVFTARPSEPKVPAQAPDSVPESLYAPGNVATNLTGLAGTYLRNVVTVLFEPDASIEERQAALDWVNGTVVGGERLPEGDGLYYVQIPSDTTANRLNSAVDALNALPQVTGAAPEFLDDADQAQDYLRPVDTGDFAKWQLDPLKADSLNWALEAIQAPDAWGCTTGSSDTHVAVVDRGFRLSTNPDLAANVTEQHYVYDQWTVASMQHGTEVASVLAAHGNDNRAMTGVMWNAQLELVEYGTDNSGLPLVVNGKFVTRNLERRIRDALWNGARVVNVSAGLNFDSATTVRIRNGGATAAEHKAVESYKNGLARWIKRYRLLGKRPLLVVTAGNDNLDAYWNAYPLLADEFPDQVIAVGAVGQAATPTGGFGSGPFYRPAFSNWGTHVQIVAPGVNVGGLDRTGTPTPHSGTSVAAPLVSGVAGLLFSLDPRLTAAEVRDLLVNGAAAGGRRVDNGIGGSYRVLNAYESLKLAAQRTGAPLCGNRVWIDHGNVQVERGPNNVETILTGDPNVVEVNPMHGSRRMVLTSYQRSWAIRWDDGSWVADTASTAFTRKGGAGEVNSLRATSHSGDTTLTLYTTELRRQVNRTDSLVTLIPFGSYSSGYTTYCAHEYVGPVTAPADTAQQRAYLEWMTLHGYASEKCDYRTSYRASARVSSTWVAYSPRYDSAMVVVNYQTDVETISGPGKCVDTVRLGVAVGDSFDVEVEYKCTDRTRTQHEDGRDVWMVSVLNGGMRAVQKANFPTYNLASVGLAEDGKEMVTRYASRSWEYTEQWQYNATTRQWELPHHTTEGSTCVMAYEVIATGAFLRTTQCGDATPVRSPATIAPLRAGGGGAQPAPVQSHRRMGNQEAAGAPGIVDRLMNWLRG